MKLLLTFCCVLCLSSECLAGEPSVKELRKAAQAAESKEKDRCWRIGTLHLEATKKYYAMPGISDKVFIMVRAQEEGLDRYIKELEKEFGVKIQKLETYWDEKGVKSALDSLTASHSEAQFSDRERKFVVLCVARYYYNGVYHLSHYHDPAESSLVKEDIDQHGDKIVPGLIYGSREDLTNYVNELRSQVRTVHLSLLNSGKIKAERVTQRQER
jgi:hypothetical protein